MEISNLRVAVAHTDGRHWRLEFVLPDGRTFMMMPYGNVNMFEAQSVCKAIMDALSKAAHAPVDAPLPQHRVMIEKPNS